MNDHSTTDKLETLEERESDTGSVKNAQTVLASLVDGWGGVMGRTQVAILSIGLLLLVSITSLGFLTFGSPLFEMASPSAVFFGMLFVATSLAASMVLGYFLATQQPTQETKLNDGTHARMKAMESKLEQRTSEFEDQRDTLWEQAASMEEQQIALEHQKAQLVEANDRIQIDNWLKTGLQTLSHKLQDKEQIEDVCHHLSTTMLAHTLADGVAVYMGKPNEGYKIQYSVPQEFSSPDAHVIQSGEGLIGRAVIENKTIHITDIPAGKFGLQTTAAKIEPSEMLLVPVNDGKEVIAVLELISIAGFRERDLEFVELSQDTIATGIRATQTRRQIRDNQVRLKAILNTAADAIITVTGDGMISSYNPAAEQMFGYSAEDTIGSSFFLLLDRFLAEDASSDDKNERLLPTDISQLVGTGHQVTGIKKDGNSFPIELSVSERIGEGKTSFTAIGRDISRQLETQKTLRLQAARLKDAQHKSELASQAKSEFLANMSHEIRTPMTAILGYSEILINNMQDGDNLDAALTIQRNGKFLLQIINDILDLSKIEADKMDIESLECSPQEIVSETVELMQVRLQGKSVRLRVEYQGQIPSTIHTDPYRLRQILINLVGNAIKFTDQGEILIRVMFENEKKKPRLRFDVSDSGIGMSQEAMNRLFHPFTQADNSTTRKFGGTGLGLTISKRLTEILGGEISVSSDVSNGSTFTFTISTGSLDGIKMLDGPSQTGETKPAVRTKQQKYSVNCRVLLVEDGPDNQRLISFILKKAGATVELAENGKIACDRILSPQEGAPEFDIILMDMQMPVMDGYSAARKLRDHSYTGPIIALTAHAMSTQRQKCVDAGCDDYATKPIDQPKLFAIIKKYTESKTNQEPADIGS